MNSQYFAGFFDADGTVTIEKYTYKRDYVHGPKAGKLRYAIKVQVGNVYRPVCQMYHERYGGSLYVRKTKSKTHRPIWVWHVNSLKAVAFLEDVVPYLTVKKRQAELALEFNTHMRKTWRALQSRSLEDPELQKIYAYRDGMHQAITSAKWIDYHSTQ